MLHIAEEDHKDEEDEDEDKDEDEEDDEINEDEKMMKMNLRMIKHEDDKIMMIKDKDNKG